MMSADVCSYCDFPLTEREKYGLEKLAAALSSYEPGRRVARSLYGYHVYFAVGAFSKADMARVGSIVKASGYTLKDLQVTPEARWTGAGDDIDLFYTGSLVVNVLVKEAS